MAVIYNKERAKYGHLTGQVINWPVPYDGDPNSAVNKKMLPAGYLKCDGTKYFAKDYPRLAAVLGTGTNCKFVRKNLDGTDYDSLLDDQFMVPDLSSKSAEPTSGANAGTYNNIRKNNELGTEKSRSGIGIDAVAAIGETNVTIAYSGSINVPSQEVEIRGKPGWNYAGASHYTEAEGPEEDALHPHTHFSSTVRSRLRAQPAILETDNDTPKPRGRTGLKNGSTIEIQTWLDKTLADNSSAKTPSTSGTITSNPAGSGQRPCNLLDNWDPNNGANGAGTPLYGSGLGCQTGYFGGCIAAESSGQYRVGSGSNFEYGCLNNTAYTVDRGTLTGSPDGSNTTKNRDRCWFIICYNDSTGDLNNGSRDTKLNVPATYVAGAVGMPTDYLGNALTDVIPLQSNVDSVDQTAVPDVENEATDTTDLTIASGTIPTLHSHRVRLQKDDHNYKVKTGAISIDPENLETTFDIGVDKSISIDSAVQPFIVMEYLIKI